MVSIFHSQEDQDTEVPESTSSNLSIEVYTGGSENPGSFIPFFSSLPVMSEVQHFTVVTENNQPARIARFVFPFQKLKVYTSLN